MIETLLGQVDTARVLAASAALQMDHGNTTELLILERLSLFAARQPTTPGRRLSSSAVRRLLQAEEIGGESVLWQLDPYEGFPVGEVIAPPSRYLVLNGLATNSVSVADRMLRAVFAQSEVPLPPIFKQRILCAARFLLSLSDTLCRRFGRSAWEEAPALTRTVMVPSASKLAELSDLVVFSPEELFGSFPDYQADFLIACFVQRHGEAAVSVGRKAASDGIAAQDQESQEAEKPEWLERMGAGEQGFPYPWETVGPGSDGLLDDGLLAVRPLVWTHLGMVVAAPTTLAASLRHLIVSEAIEHGCLAELVAAIKHVSVSEVQFWLDMLVDEPLQEVSWRQPHAGPDANDDDAHWRARFIAPFDGDKLLDVRVVVDDLSRYDLLSIWGHAQTPPISVEPVDHRAEKVLTLDLMVNLGRDWAFLGRHSESPGLHATLDELEALIAAPGTDALTLWYFAQAYGRLRERANVVAFSILDSFSVFRDHRESFYLSDDHVPTHVSLEVGTAQDLRKQAADEIGPPYVVIGDTTARAVRCFGSSAPISMVIADPRVCFLTMPDRTVWTRCRTAMTSGFGREADANSEPVVPRSNEGRGAPTGDEGLVSGAEVGAGPAQLEHHLAQSIAYWLWQLSLAAPQLFEVVAYGADVVVDAVLSIDDLTEVAEVSPVTRRSDAAPRGAAVKDWVELQAGSLPVPLAYERPAVGFTLRVRPPALTGDGEPPNARDRTLVSRLIDGLIGSVTSDAADSVPGATPLAHWSAEQRQSLLDAVAPAGHKQLTHMTSSDENPLYWPGRLPPARRVRDAARALVLDGVAKHLTDLGIPVGPIPNEERTQFLNQSVTAYLIDWLTAEIDQVDASTTLPHVAMLWEALMHETAVDAQRLPSQIACFGEEANGVKALKRRRHVAAETSIALRFLIEFLSARRPSGSKPLTQERTDLLIALAAEIVSKGQLSDTLRFGLADHMVSRLPSGRLGVDWDDERYGAARQAFSEDLAMEAIVDARSMAQQDWRRDLGLLDDKLASGDMSSGRGPSDSDNSMPFEAMDELARGEYGFSYTHLTKACAALIDASRNLDQEDLGFLEHGHALQVVGEALEADEETASKLLAALSLAPMDDYWAAKSDVFPWTFNRDRSYLRQPLIVERRPRVTDAQAAAGAETNVILFGHRNLFLTPQHWYERHKSGRLRARTRPMRQAIAAALKAKGDNFELAVEAKAREAGAIAVRRRFKRAGALNLRNVDGQDLGDVDVLAVAGSGDIFIIEAKALEMARTPHEMANEAEGLIVGPKAAVVRVQTRADALKRHRHDVERALGLEPMPRRRFCPLVVTDQRLLGSYLNSSGVPIIRLDDLGAVLATT